MEASSNKTVRRGLYFGFTRQELDEEMGRYKRAVKQRSVMAEISGGGGIKTGEINGEKVEFLPGGVESLEEWRIHLQEAFAQVEALEVSAEDLTPNVTVGRFR